MDQAPCTTTKNTFHTTWWTRTSTSVYNWTIQNNTHNRYTNRWFITDKRWMDYNRHAHRTTIHMEGNNRLYAQGQVWVYTWRCCSTTAKTSRHTTGSKESQRQATAYTTDKTGDGGACAYTFALQEPVSHLRQSKRKARFLQTATIKAASRTDWLCIPQDIYRWAKPCSTCSSWCTIATMRGTSSTRQSNTAWLHDQQPTLIHSWMWTHKWQNPLWQWTYIEDSSYRSSRKDWKHYS